MPEFIDRQLEREVRTCDSCGEKIDMTVEPGRWRHRDCPPPPMPPAALAVFAQIDKMRSRATPKRQR